MTSDAEGGDRPYWGWCPECGRSDGYLNIGKDHWFRCDEHQTRWCVGSNLFSSWQNETEATWERNEQHIASYREVDGWTPTVAMLEEALKSTDIVRE